MIDIDFLVVVDLLLLFCSFIVFLLAIIVFVVGLCFPKMSNPDVVRLLVSVCFGLLVTFCVVFVIGHFCSSNSFFHSNSILDSFGGSHA